MQTNCPPRMLLKANNSAGTVCGGQLMCLFDASMSCDRQICIQFLRAMHVGSSGLLLSATGEFLLSFFLYKRT